MSRQPSRRALDRSRARFDARRCANRTMLLPGVARFEWGHAPVVVVRRRLWPPPFKRWFWSCWFCTDVEPVVEPPTFGPTATRLIRPVSRPNGGDDDDSR